MLAFQQTSTHVKTESSSSKVLPSLWCVINNKIPNHYYLIIIIIIIIKILNIFCETTDYEFMTMLTITIAIRIMGVFMTLIRITGLRLPL